MDVSECQFQIIDFVIICVQVFHFYWFFFLQNIVYTRHTIREVTKMIRKAFYFQLIKKKNVEVYNKQPYYLITLTIIGK